MCLQELIFLHLKYQKVCKENPLLVYIITVTLWLRYLTKKTWLYCNTHTVFLVQLIVIAICQEVPFTACNLFLNYNFHERNLKKEWTCSNGFFCIWNIKICVITMPQWINYYCYSCDLDIWSCCIVVNLKFSLVHLWPVL